MKKRILALALAGTTAFSVFGAAMSANAAVYLLGNGTTHVNANDGAYYQPYQPAGKINWNRNYSAATYTTIDGDVYYPGTKEEFESTYTEMYNGNRIVPANVLYMAPGYLPSNSAAIKDQLDIVGKDTFTYYYDDMADFVKKNNYTTIATKDGTYTFNKVDYQIATKNADGTVYVFTKDNWDDMDQTDYTAVNAAGNYYLDKSFNGEDQVIYTADQIVSKFANGGSKVKYYYIYDNTGLNVAGTSLEVGSATSNMHRVKGQTACVATKDAATTENVWSDGGASMLNSVDVNDADAILEETVVSNGVVYLYDYYYSNDYDRRFSADSFTEAWAEGDLAEELYKLTGHATGSIAPETGYNYNSVRGEILMAWEDFLYELGITDPTDDAALSAWGEQTVKNYAFMYYDSSITPTAVQDSRGNWTIYWGGNVNLYNFDALVKDIMDLAPAAKATNAQTSELVYLMQQYDKYVDGGFVDIEPVETDDWGDLLVSLLQAPTEDDFRTERYYKNYTDKVEDLVEDYTDAQTSVAVSLAEKAMYNFVTEYSSAYAASTTKLDKSALTTAIDNTYFNADWKVVGESYGGIINNGVLRNNIVVDSNYKYTDGAVSPAAWAMYPLADYTVNYLTDNYPGVDLDAIYANDSYRWFYNVYALVYNIYNESKYQSVVDAAAEALNEAVANLTVSSSAAAPDSYVLRAEEQNDKLADLIETDYTSSMWANREKINTYINDRVSANEIGKQGSANASIIASETARLMGRQQYQTVVTKSDITSVKSAQSNANTALTALRNDEDNYNAAQANALTKAIDSCQYIIDLYNGKYSTSEKNQSVNSVFTAAVGDKDQILKSMITAAVEEVDAAINFKEVLQGWHEFDEGWKYGTEEGYLTGGWKQVPGDKSWYYFNEDGIALENEWIKENGKWYYLNSNCAAAYGWAKVDGKWYYFNGDNSMRTGWVKTGGHWYYLNAGGAMVTGWAQIDGKWYYFKKSENALGQMEYSTTVDGYKLGADGAWIK